MPIHKLCDPCQFNVTHVTRMESFTADAAAILRYVGVKDVMSVLDEKNHVSRAVVECNLTKENRICNPMKE